MASFLHSAEINARAYFSQHLNIQAFGGSFRCFKLNDNIKYRPFCDDFGPMNLACIVRFIQSIDTELASFPSSKIIWCLDSGRRSLTNAVFLLGAYMIVKQAKAVHEIVGRFAWIDADMLEPTPHTPSLTFACISSTAGWVSKRASSTAGCATPRPATGGARST